LRPEVRANLSKKIRFDLAEKSLRILSREGFFHVNPQMLRPACIFLTAVFFHHDRFHARNVRAEATRLEGKVQRSGYPDLRIVDLASKRVFYLAPKLYAAGSRDMYRSEAIVASSPK